MEEWKGRSGKWIQRGKEGNTRRSLPTKSEQTEAGRRGGYWRDGKMDIGWRKWFEGQCGFVTVAFRNQRISLST